MSSDAVLGSFERSDRLKNRCSFNTTIRWKMCSSELPRDAK